MEKPTLIIVSGLPATGKTTLSKKISEELSLPLVSMDGIKEVMWGELGHKYNLGFSNKIGASAFELAFYFMESLLSKGKSLVAEAHFHPDRNNERFNSLVEKYGTKLIQIHCDCETEVLQKRFKERSKTDSYHAGHKHTVSLYGEERIMKSLGNKNKRLDINGATFDLDTTEPEKIDYEKLFGFVRSSF